MTKHQLSLGRASPSTGLRLGSGRGTKKAPLFEAGLSPGLSGSCIECRTAAFNNLRTARMLYYQRSFLFPFRRIFLIFHPLEIKALKELAVDQKGAPPKRGSLGKGRIAQEGREADNPSLGRLCDP